MKPFFQILRFILLLIVGCLIPVASHLGLLTGRIETVFSIGAILFFAAGLFCALFGHRMSSSWKYIFLTAIVVPTVAWMIFLFSRRPEIFSYFNPSSAFAFALSFISGYLMVKWKYPGAVLWALVPFLLIFLFWIIIWPRMEYTIRDATEKKPISVPFNRNYPLLTSTGDTVYTDSFRGKVVMLDFWAPYCAACYEKISEMEKIDPSSRKNVEIFIVEPGVHLLHRNRLDDIKKLQKETTLKVLFDIEGNLSKHFQVEGIPEEFIFDRKGNLIHRFSGFNEVIQPIYRSKIENILDTHQ